MTAQDTVLIERPPASGPARPGKPVLDCVPTDSVARTYRVVRIVRQAPVTVAVLLLLIALGGLSGALLDGPAIQLARRFGAGLGSLSTGNWWVVGTAGLWCSGITAYLISTALILIVLPFAERRIGSGRTALILLSTQVLGVATGLALARLIVMHGGQWSFQLSRAVTVDRSAAVLGVALAVSAALPTLWRRRIRLVLLVGLLMLALYSGLLVDLVRLTTGLVGLGLGMLLVRGDRAPAGPSRPEIRVLVALMLAASAIGPLVAALGSNGGGPFAVLRYVLAAPPPDALTVQQICADTGAAGRTCAVLQAQLRGYGVGPAILSVMPALLLLVAAEGLRRGRRAAWIAAIALQACLAGLGLVLAVTALTSPAHERVTFGPGPNLHGWTVLMLPFVQPLLGIVLLLVARRGFEVRAPVGTYRRWIGLACLTLLTVSVVYVVGSLAASDSYDRPVDLRALLTDLPARFVPPGYLGEVKPRFLPDHMPAVLLYEWTGVVFWVVTAMAALITFVRPQLPAQTSAAARVRELLVEHGGNNLSHMVTWAGNSYWFTDDFRAAMAYRVIGGVAVTTGSPIGDPERRAAAVYGFIVHCHRSGWTPCLYSVDEETVAETRAMGWQDVQVAAETVLPLPGLKFTGKAWQDVRTTFNKAAAAGIVAEWCNFRTAPLAITDQIRVISEAWVAEKGLPELGFTLGGLDELADDDVRLLIAVDAERTVHAVTSWLPVYRDRVIVGWTLDFMRRRVHGFRGSTEFLIASAALLCQADGDEFISLSGAPLARIDSGKPVAGLQRALDLTSRLLEPIYGFRSLLAFKAKFQPVYRPLYLAYPDTAALPAIGNAIGRAYLPHLTTGQLTRLARRILG